VAYAMYHSRFAHIPTLARLCDQITNDLFCHARVVFQKQPDYALAITAVAHQSGECGDSARARAAVAQLRVLLRCIKIHVLDTDTGYNL
jgi:hypothetical protein